MADENAPLLPSTNGPSSEEGHRWGSKKFKVISGVVIAVVLVAAVGLAAAFNPEKVKKAIEHGPSDPSERALWLLDKSPVIDGHIDLPELTRVLYSNNISSFDLNKEMPMHVDIPRLRKGKTGGFFWSVFTNCPTEPLIGKGDFLDPTESVRDTLEQIDVAHLLIEKYSDTFALCTTADDVRNAIAAGKIASLLGVEGAHQLENSLPVLRAYAALGVKYVTLSHSCNNAFADSAGIFNKVTPYNDGLSDLGVALIYELNRLGIMVDISHVADTTALDALKATRAPVMWSHSASRHFVDIQRNVPDYILKMIGRTEDKVDGVVMVNFAPYFVYPGGGEGATLDVVANHIDHIAGLIGHEHVGLGSDYDGIEAGPTGLEDVSKYPDLFAELYRRNWTDTQLAMLSGGNILRIMEGVEKTKKEMEGLPASMARYSKRTDLGTRA